MHLRAQKKNRKKEKNQSKCPKKDEKPIAIQISLFTTKQQQQKKIINPNLSFETNKSTMKWLQIFREVEHPLMESM